MAGPKAEKEPAGSKVRSVSHKPPNLRCSGPSKRAAVVRPLSFVVRRLETRHGLGSTSPMKIATGFVVDGKVVVEGETLTEGETVTVLLREDEEAFELTPEEEEELLESIAEIERGEFISGEEFVERLRRFG
jgi:hypothetical protein